MATYQLWLSSPFGVRAAVIPHEAIVKLSYTLTANAVGALTATIDRDAIPEALVTADAQVEVWRRPDGGPARKEGDGPWLLETDTLGLASDGGRYRTLKALTANTILDWRRVLYYANDATYSAPAAAAADDLMKAIVRQNMGSSADSSPLVVGAVWPSRSWTAYLSIDADVTAGPAVSKAFAWRSVLGTLQEIGRDAAGAGLPVYFDVVAGETTMLAFRTWVGVRGVDRSASLVVSPERGSLGGTVERVVDWSGMATAIAAGGQGQDSARVIGTAFDASRIGLSPFGLREQFLDATALSSPAALAAEANAELRARRPTKVLSGSLVSVPGAVYGTDWGFGDALVAAFEGDAFLARVDGVTVAVASGKETVTAAIKGELT